MALLCGASLFAPLVDRCFACDGAACASVRARETLSHDDEEKSEEIAAVDREHENNNGSTKIATATVGDGEGGGGGGGGGADGYGGNMNDIVDAIIREAKNQSAANAVVVERGGGGITITQLDDALAFKPLSAEEEDSGGVYISRVLEVKIPQ